MQRIRDGSMCPTPRSDNMKYKVGMYGGKFCPLHKGHYSVIERALSECERLFVVLFINSDMEKDMPVRWFTIPAFRFYQLNKAKEIYQQVNGLKEPPQMEILILDSSELSDGGEDWHKEAHWIQQRCGPIDAIYSSEPEYDPFFKEAYPTATHVLVDPERRNVPISATELRAKEDYSQELLRWLI